ncbi:Glycosyltransferase involved in cell wall bisynthesis [Nitrosospira multiformis ATCC 25196]|uniref:Glycosyltransferase involved in cell wall bisynthesis n=2 Tax=Nitrosospira multiformis (strain ATCC 25196 / NCIMB 11849 / C 71) TaxID=323848 RepID=A0A1H5V474_NITMU|nr:glycosyltransferase family 4 protein [Nitrosospira multiformis]SEF81217.1 Glycosyltransferase involved in cell wall bisynthesis [Nitrosospira multiformis ATCC 25196]
MNKGKISLMLGTDSTGRGGIASVVTLLQEEGFLDQQNVKYITSHREGTHFKKLAIMFSATGKVLWYCMFAKPAIVHVHSASGASFIRKSIFLAVARLFRCQTVFHLHGGRFPHFASEESGVLLKWWIRRTLERSSTVIALSESWAAFLSTCAPAAAIQIVPNSVRLAKISSKQRGEAGRILFLGHVGKGKGIFELLKALSLLKDSLPYIRLVVCGDGCLDSVQKMADELGIASNVEFRGWVDASQKAEELARASVFVLPSHDEGLPMAMLEAMAAERAIIVTPVGGIPEVIRDRENGLLVPPRDADALAQALKEVLENPLLRQMLAENALRTIESRFSTPVILGQLSLLYERLRGGSRGEVVAFIK